jgi:hypothetical protein
VFNTSVLRFGSDTCLANAGIAVDLTPPEFLARSISLEWAADAESFERFRQRIAAGALNAGFQIEDLGIVVLASSTYLKIASHVLACPVPELERLSRVTDLVRNRKPEAFRAPFSGFTVDAYLVLARAGPPLPLRPHRLGTWIARAQFRIETSLGAGVLPPTPLTDEIRHRLGLPAKTVRFLDFRGHDLLQPYVEQEQPVFYVDDRLLAQMSARRNSGASKALQLQLACDFVAAVAWRASANPELTGMSYADLRTSLLGSVLRVAAGPGASDQDIERLLSETRDATEHVIARAEHFIDVASGFSDILEDGEL